MRKRFLYALLVTVMIAVFPFGAHATPGDLVVTSEPAVSEGFDGTTLNATTTLQNPSSYGFEYGPTNSYGTNEESTSPLAYQQFDFAIGTYGTGDEQFERPGRIAVDSAGNVYVVDDTTMNVEKYNSSGQFLLSFGSEGTGDGQFTNPRGIAVDPSDDVYVVNAHYDIDGTVSRVQKFSSDGTFLFEFGTDGSGNGQLDEPQGITITPDGTIYIADSFNNRIQVFNSAGVYQSEFGTYGSSNGEFSHPADVEFDSDGNIYVADAGNHRIQKFDSNAQYTDTFEDPPDSSLSYPRHIAISTDGRIYVGDVNHLMVTYDSEGNYLGQFGSVGSGDGQFEGRADFASDGQGGLWITDYYIQKVSHFIKATTADFNLEVTDLECDTTYHFRSWATNFEETAYGEDATFLIACPPDFSLDFSLDSVPPVVNTDTVDYQVTISNIGSADSPYAGSVYIITPSEFTFSSNTNPAVQCIDQGLADDSGDPYMISHFSGHHFVVCVPTGSEIISGNGGTIQFTMSGIATSDFVIDATTIKGIYFDADNEPEFSQAFNDAYVAGVDFTTLPFNNVATSVYGETPDPPATTTTTTTASPSSTTTSTGTSPTTTQPNVATTTQPITPVEESTTSTTTTAVTTTNPNQPTETTSPGNTAGEPVPDSGGEDTNHSDSPGILGLFSATGAFILRNIFLVSILLLIGGTITFVARRRKKIA